MNARRALLSLLIGFCLTAVGAKAADDGPSKLPVAADEDWPQFLGPLGTGVTGANGLVDRWPGGEPPVLWSRQIGAGYSAPSVRGERLVFHHRLRMSEIVECVHPDTGKPIWKFEYPSHFTDPYGYNNGPRCTPLLTANRCYTFGAEGKLLCLDLTSGKKLWMRDTSPDFNVPAGFFGVGCTPILEGGLLIVLVGGQPDAGVVAFRAETGETVWKNVGQKTWRDAETDWPTEPKYHWTGTEMIVSYTSPIVATIHGRRHLLCLMRQGLVSLDPANGRLNFKYWFCSRDYESVTAARPVVIDDKIFLSAAYRVGSALLQVAPSGMDYRVIWRNHQNLLAHWSTPIAVGGFIYGFSGRHESEGELRCIELKTGKVVWKHRGYEGDPDQLGLDTQTGAIKDRTTGKTVPFPFFGRGSLTLAGDRFFILGERGTLAMADLSPSGYKERCRASFPEIGYPVWPSPVVARKKVYLRDENTLLCVDLARR